jgi:thiol-disulfide isomerase/thioredoxin
MTGRLAVSLLAVLLATLLFGCGAPRSAGTPEEAGSIEVRPATVEQLLAAVRAPGARVVLLNVWATWCTPCREEFPDLLRLEREHRARGLRLVLISGDFDSELPAVRRFLTAQGVDFLTYLKQGDDMPFIDGLDARWTGALPATLLYDGAGRGLWFHEGRAAYDTLKTRIEEALAAPAVPGH